VLAAALSLLLLAPSARAAEDCPSVSSTATLAVPLVRQATTYSCGPASLLSILYYWGVYDHGESALYPALGTTPEDGTRPDKLVEAAKSFGLSAELREGATLCDLRRAVAAGETVIVNFQAWGEGATAKLPWREDWEDGHYAVLVGMTADRAYFMDPSTGGALAYVPLSELPARWHDYDKIDGKVRRWNRLALFIGGKTHLKSLPAEPVRLE
jgi:predicted double-glycine peptidase